MTFFSKPLRLSYLVMIFSCIRNRALLSLTQDYSGLIENFTSISAYAETGYIESVFSLLLCGTPEAKKKNLKPTRFDGCGWQTFRTTNGSRAFPA